MWVSGRGTKGRGNMQPDWERKTRGERIVGYGRGHGSTRPVACRAPGAQPAAEQGRGLQHPSWCPASASSQASKGKARKDWQREQAGTPQLQLTGSGQSLSSVQSACSWESVRSTLLLKGSNLEPPSWRAPPELPAAPLQTPAWLQPGKRGNKLVQRAGCLVG